MVRKVRSGDDVLPRKNIGAMVRKVRFGDAVKTITCLADVARRPLSFATQPRGR